MCVRGGNDAPVEPVAAGEAAGDVNNYNAVYFLCVAVLSRRVPAS